MTRQAPKLSPKQIAALGPRKMSAEDAHAEWLRHVSRSYALQSSWILGLAVANGGALTALASKLLDSLAKSPDERATAAFALAYPSMWFFAIGLVTAGVAALQEMLQTQKMIEESHQSIRVQQQIAGAEVLDTLNPTTWKQWAPEIASGMAFVIGLTYPLAVLAIRYFQAGGFTW